MVLQIMLTKKLLPFLYRSCQDWMSKSAGDQVAKALHLGQKAHRAWDHSGMFVQDSRFVDLFLD